MYPVSDAFKAALLRSHRPVSRIEVWSGIGGRYLGALPFTDASVAIDSSNDQRRQLTVTLTDADGSYTPQVPADLLAPVGNDLRPYRGIQYADGSQELVPLGVFPLTDTSVTYDGRSRPITITAPDRAQVVQAAKPTDFYTVAAGTNAATAIMNLINSVVPGLTYNLEITTFTTGLVVLNPGDDPWAAARGIATSAGQDLSFDASGVVTTRTVPDPNVAPISFDYADGALNTVTSTTKLLTVTGTYNVIVATAEGPDVGTPLRTVSQDLDPSSPTYVLGPLGARVSTIKTDQATTLAQLQAMGDAELRRSSGLLAQVTFNGITNPATDAYDVITIEQASAKVSGRYIITAATIPLLWSQLMQITTRARTIS